MSQVTTDDLLGHVTGYAIPAALIVDAGRPAAEAAAVVRAAQAFYGFWAGLRSFEGADLTGVAAVL